jgi:hypothetical protein
VNEEDSFVVLKFTGDAKGLFSRTVIKSGGKVILSEGFYNIFVVGLAILRMKCVMGSEASYRICTFKPTNQRVLKRRSEVKRTSSHE